MKELHEKNIPKDTFNYIIELIQYKLYGDKFEEGVKAGKHISDRYVNNRNVYMEYAIIQFISSLKDKSKPDRSIYYLGIIKGIKQG